MIQIKNLTKRFGDNVVLDSLNLDIHDGDLLAITGTSGCGKTTLLNILGLIDSNYEGDILYNGESLKNLKKSKRQLFIRNNISYLFQNYALIDDEDVKSNLALALYYEKMTKIEKERTIKNVLEKLGLTGYEKKKIFTLSGGEQQRVSIARTMIKKGNIILADEPTGNLDDENRDIVIRSLIELNQMGKTIVVVTHDDYVAKKCRRMIQL